MQGKERIPPDEREGEGAAAAREERGEPCRPEQRTAAIVLYVHAAASADSPSARASGSEASVNAGPYTEVVSTHFSPTYGNAGSFGNSDGVWTYGFASWTAAIRP